MILQPLSIAPNRPSFLTWERDRTRSGRAAPASVERSLRPIDLLRRVEFAAALSLLQSMIGERVAVVVSLRGYFFDCGFKARLQRVATLAERDGPVLIVLESAQAIALDPAELESFVGYMPGRHAACWVEFHIGHRAWLLIEPLAGPGVG